MSRHSVESTEETETGSAYHNALAHLSDELCKLDACLHLQVVKLRARHAPQKVAEFAGLYIAEEEIDQVLAEDSNVQAVPESALKDADSTAMLNQIETLQATITARVEASLRQGIVLPLYQLADLFHLTPFELDAILICLAPELDLKYETLYAYLHNDVTKKQPTVNLILDLLCSNQEQRLNARTAFYAQAPLFKYGLLKFVADAEHRPLLARCVQLEERIVNFLLGFNLLDARLTTFAEIITPQRDWSTLVLDESLKERLRRLSSEHFNNGNGQKLILSLYGPYGAGKKLAAEAFCQELQLPLIIADLNILFQTDVPFEQALRLLFREALLQPAAIYLEHFDHLLTDDPKHQYYQELILKAIAELSLVTFLAGEKPWNPHAHVNQHIFIPIEFPLPTYPQRNQLWEMALHGQAALSSEVNLAALANQFRLTGGQISNAVATARNLVHLRSSDNNGHITMADLYQSCRVQSNQKLAELAQKIMPHYTWPDIVLPADKRQQLREICNYVKYRSVVYDEWGFDRKLSLGKGLNVLFAGPSGTGKTMAAEIIANELKFDLYKIDLSSVVSKYIGETEKNLSKIFQEAETSNAILFFDEADALFGKRSEVKDAHDRYANIEIGYLLQRMETYTGVVILATNLHNNMDEAFVRRMHVTVEFPFPDETYRLHIWQRIFPKETPLEEAIDFTFMARKFKMSGGNIKNIALTAAFYAANDSSLVTMTHLIRATKREYQKMKRLCDQSDFGEYYKLIQDY